MSTHFSEQSLRKLAHQLSHPSGKEGIAVANQMHQHNFPMTQKSIHLLNIQSHDRVLELGHGNGAHVHYLLQQAEGIHYTGLEISTLMNQEAIQINHESVHHNQSQFTLYDGVSIPFPDRSFSRVFTVNTIYFWSAPSLLLQEICRVLDIEGRFVITFMPKEYMTKLPFTRHGFTLYHAQEVDDLVLKNGFSKLESADLVDQVEAKSGKTHDRCFSVRVYQRN